ncbi:helix-turn-helix transcriptional regulator [Streptomyces sp. NPDC048518]|uniref:helix-turn-helix transcriptional regulator n=1 Tax=Streptomyces sp. NPDC048518 TaxID=3155029 RepID=UPI0033EF3873
MREGRIPHEDVEVAPCLVDFGLLHPELDDERWLRPASPHAVLSQLVRTIENRIATHREREEMLTAAFRQFLALDAERRSPEPDDDPGIAVLSGAQRINTAVAHAMGEATDEFLAVQPDNSRQPQELATALAQSLPSLPRNCRMRTLCQKATSPSRAPLAQLHRLRGDVEARTLDEVTEPLLIFDRTVAFIPMGQYRKDALELRNPALVQYFATTFWRLWGLAAPLWTRRAVPSENREAAPRSSAGRMTTIQHTVAALLIEGLTDAEIAGRLGMNIRTARVHIAKLAATLGSHSRAQLGYLIGQSGILGRGE